MGKPKIEGGYILEARKQLESSIMDRPPLDAKLWSWMKLKAYHKDHNGLERGQFFTTIAQMRDAMSWHVGYRKVTPTIKEIRRAYERFTKDSMIGTAKATHGMVITILNYDYYQNKKNYEGHDEGHDEKDTKGQRGAQYKQECKEQNNPLYPPWLPVDVWKEFKKHRIKLKSPMTDHAEKLAIGKIEKLRLEGHDPADVINNCIEMGWKGIFPPKRNGAPPPHQMQYEEL